MTLHKHQHVIVSGAAGTCHAEVMHVEEPGSQPALHGQAEVDRVRSILREWHVTELALLVHIHDCLPVSFFALRVEDGTWKDLQGQALTITAIDEKS